MGNPPEGFLWDHIDRNIYNNYESNLRLATRSQNYMNRVKPDRFKECSSIYKGVAWNKKGQKWIVYISFKGKQIYLGMFISEIEAAKAYDRAAIAYFDEFACLNFKREDYTINDF